METSLIDLSTFHDLAKADIGAFSPKPTSIEGDQVEAARSLRLGAFDSRVTPAQERM